jgi:hypothetical protein
VDAGAVEFRLRPGVLWPTARRACPAKRLHIARALAVKARPTPLPPPFHRPPSTSSPVRRPHCLRYRSQLRRACLCQPPRRHTQKLAHSIACPHSTISSRWVSRWVKVEGESPNRIPSGVELRHGRRHCELTAGISFRSPPHLVLVRTCLGHSRGGRMTTPGPVAPLAANTTSTAAALTVPRWHARRRPCSGPPLEPLSVLFISLGHTGVVAVILWFV